MSSNNLSIVPPSPEGHGSEGRSPSQQSPRRQAAPAPEAEAPPPVDPGQRLMIEEAEGGELIYTVIDRASGAVVVRASREGVAQMGRKPDYAAGSLIQVKA
jgi:hypothetical protein